MHRFLHTFNKYLVPGKASVLITTNFSPELKQNSQVLFSHVNVHSRVRLFSVSSCQFDIVQKKIAVNKILINFTIVGSGPHALLCLPGIYGSIETDFEPILEKFDLNKFTLICVDAPGCGKSRPPDRSIHGNPYASDAESAAMLMKTLDIPKYSILGWSNGGIIGVFLATGHSANVEKFVLWGSQAFFNEKSIKLAEIMLDSDHWIPARWDMMIKLYGEKTFKFMLQDFYKYALHCVKTSSFRIDLLYPTITAPTLILHGTNDMLCSIEHAQKYNEGIPNSKLEIWPKAQHDLHLQFQDKFIERVQNFILTGQ